MSLGSWTKKALGAVWRKLQDMEHNYPMSAGRRNKIRDYYGSEHEPKDRFGNPVPKSFEKDR